MEQENYLGLPRKSQSKNIGSLILGVALVIICIIGIFNNIIVTREANKQDPPAQVQNDWIVTTNEVIRLKESDSLNQLKIRDLEKKYQNLLLRTDSIVHRVDRHDTAFNKVATWINEVTSWN